MTPLPRFAAVTSARLLFVLVLVGVPAAILLLLVLLDVLLVGLGDLATLDGPEPALNLVKLVLSAHLHPGREAVKV